MAIIYPNISGLYTFWVAFNQLGCEKDISEYESDEIQGYFNAYCEDAKVTKYELGLHDIETLKAYDKGLLPNDLQKHNRKTLGEDHEPEYTGVPFFIEKIFGEGTISMVRDMIEDVGDNPEKAVELLDWVAKSWPEWKERIDPFIKKYKPVVKDMTQTAAEAIAPLVDMPAILLFGMSLREEVQEQRAFRSKAINMCDKIAEHFETKSEMIKSPEELELDN